METQTDDISEWLLREIAEADKMVLAGTRANRSGEKPTFILNMAAQVWSRRARILRECLFLHENRPMPKEAWDLMLAVKQMPVDAPEAMRMLGLDRCAAWADEIQDHARNVEVYTNRRKQK